MKRLSFVLVVILAASGSELLVTRSVAEAHFCEMCRRWSCVYSGRRGWANCYLEVIIRNRKRTFLCTMEGACPFRHLPRRGQRGSAPAGPDLPVETGLALAEITSDRMRGPALLPADACRPAPTTIAICSIANGEPSGGCESLWDSGSRTRRGGPSEPHSGTATAGP